MKKKTIKTGIVFFTLIFSFNYFFGQQNLKQDLVTASTDTTIYTELPTMPEFGKDKSALQEFIVKQSKYPASTKRTSTTKNVFVQVLIEKNGKVIFRKIVRGYDEKFDIEAKRIVEKMPNWSIGKLSNGTPARIEMMFPIWFE